MERFSDDEIMARRAFLSSWERMRLASSSVRLVERSVRDVESVERRWVRMERAVVKAGRDF